MKIEFTKEEINAIILEAACRFDPQINTVKIENVYGSYIATVSYVDPVEAEKEKQRIDEIIAKYHKIELLEAE